MYRSGVPPATLTRPRRLLSWGSVEASSAPIPEESPAERGRSLRTAAMLTAVVGALHAILFLTSWWLLSDAPGPDATDAEIVDYYTSASSRRVTLAGLYVTPFAGIAFIWFLVAMRMWIEGTAHRRSILQSNVQLVAGILYVGMFFAAGAALSVLAAGIEFDDTSVDPVVSRAFPVYGGSLFFVFAFRMAAMFVFTTSAIAHRAGILPRWFAWLGYVVGAFLLLSASFELWFVLVFPVWLFVFSALLLNTARRIDPELRLPKERRDPLIVRQPRARPARR